MINLYDRVAELRKEDPHGRRSDSELERQARIEQIDRMIRDLPDCGPLVVIRDIFEEIMRVLP